MNFKVCGLDGEKFFTYEEAATLDFACLRAAKLSTKVRDVFYVFDGPKLRASAEDGVARWLRPCIACPATPGRGLYGLGLCYSCAGLGLRIDDSWKGVIA